MTAGHPPADRARSPPPQIVGKLSADDTPAGYAADDTHTFADRRQICPQLLPEACPQDMPPQIVPEAAHSAALALGDIPQPTLCPCSLALGARCSGWHPAACVLPLWVVVAAVLSSTAAYVLPCSAAVCAAAFKVIPTNQLKSIQNQLKSIQIRFLNFRFSIFLGLEKWNGCQSAFSIGIQSRSIPCMAFFCPLSFSIVYIFPCQSVLSPRLGRGNDIRCHSNSGRLNTCNICKLSSLVFVCTLFFTSQIVVYVLSTADRRRSDRRLSDRWRSVPRRLFSFSAVPRFIPLYRRQLI